MARTSAFVPRERSVRLPAPLAANWELQLRAACRGAGTTAFFVDELTSVDAGSVGSRAELDAKKICEGCAVKDPCGRYAVDAGEPEGIWGGMTPSERRQYKWFTRTATRPSDAPGRGGI